MCAAVSLCLTLGALSLAGCGGDSGSSSGCGQPFREPLHPGSLQHVIDGSKVKYDTDPPTSGPHLFTPPARGAVDRQLLPAEQVTVLETGDVLVQFRDPADAAVVRSLRQTGVTVAPNKTLVKRVVATAWTYKLECGSVDSSALQKFIAAHKGQPAHAGG